MKIQEYITDKKSYFIVVVACLTLYLFNPQILRLLDKVVEWINPCPQWCFATLILLFGLYFTLLVASKIKQKRLHLADRSLAAAIFFVLVYLYFRFIDKNYEFWPMNSSLKWTDIIFLPFVLLLVLKYQTKEKHDVSSQLLLLQDAPITKPDEDLLGYDTLSIGLLKDLNATDVTTKSYSVGIIGPWGHGKSSFLNLFKYHAEKQGSIVVTFNPRLSKSIQSIQEDFFNQFKGELSHYHTGIRRHISNYTKEVAITDEGWIGKVALACNELFQSEEKIHINNLIGLINKRIFVVVEDFDRLTAKEILEVLKLIDSNGDFRNKIYLTAFDKKYVNGVLNNYLGSPSEHPFTDKYFNYEYLLPTFKNDVSKHFFSKLIFEELDMPDNSVVSKESLLDAWEEVCDIVVSCLPNLRHIKRYFNIFATRYLEVGNDVDASDFMLLTLLRYNDIEAYNSLFNFTFLRRGTFLKGGTDKKIYLQENYNNNSSFNSLLPSSKKIIEHLFSEVKEGSYMPISMVYGKLRWADSFNSYFYDYRIGEYHLEDFYDLFKIEEGAAFDEMEAICSDGYSVQLEDFLVSRDINWITNSSELERMIKLSLQLDSIKQSVNSRAMLLQFTHSFAEDGYIKSGAIKDKDSYKAVVLNAFRASLETFAIQIGYVGQTILEEINSKQLGEKDFIFSKQEVIDLAVSAQKVYYSRYPEGEYKFNAILSLSNIYEIQNGSIVTVKAAQEELSSLMKLYPDKFAKDLVQVSRSYESDGMNIVNLRFNDNFRLEEYMSWNGFTINDWMSNIRDTTIAYVVRQIVERYLKNEVLTVPALKPEYYQSDFEGFYDAIKAKYEIDDDKAVLKAIQNNNTPDLYSLSIASFIPKERVEAAIKRLVTNGQIDGEYMKIKDRIDPFEKGDLVKLTDAAFEKDKSQLIYSNNVFKILELSLDGSVKLSNLSQSVSISDIEAIKINGVQDRCIYYDPIIAAPIVPYGAPAPVIKNHRGEYYMNGLANTTYNDKTFKQLVLEADCRYVHEVQHYLQKHFKSDDLKVDEKIK